MQRSERHWSRWISVFAIMAWFGTSPVSAQLGGTELPKMTPVEIAARVNWDPQCSNYAIVGYCYCPYTPCAWAVAHFVPVSFIETVRKSGETMVAAVDFSQMTLAMGATFQSLVRQINQEGMDNSFEAHNYNLPEKLLQYATACMTCKPSYAEQPYMDSSGGYLGNYGGGLCGNLVNFTKQISKFTDIGGNPLAGYNMKMFYASEADVLHWRTGCRDLSLTNLLKSNAFTCTAAGIADLIGSAEPIAKWLGADACIGNWGPLYPRQMRTRGPTQIQASAIAAYRSISVARTDTQTFPYSVDTNSKLQIAYPQLSKCTKVGSIPMNLTMKASTDGAFGWIYWRPVACCIPFEAPTTCYS